MIIDFRLRPPAKGFLQTIMYREVERTAKFTVSMGMTQPPSVTNKSLDLTIKEMDEAGIVKGVIPGRRANPNIGNISNEDIAQIIGDYPGRFVGFAGIDPSDREQALAEIDSTVLRGPFKGIVLEPGLLPEPMHYNDKRLYFIYETCSRMGIPVMTMGGGNAGPDLSYTLPIAVDQVAADFPDLVMVIAHGGWPWVTQMIQVAFRRPNLWISPDMYMVNMPGVQDYVMAANYVLQDRFLFASSYPFIPMKEGVEYFKHLAIKTEIMDKLLYKNAARLLGV